MGEYVFVYYTRGVLLGAISKELDKIVEFTAFGDFISFEKKAKIRLKE